MVNVVIPHYGENAFLKTCLMSIDQSSLVDNVEVIDNNENNIGFTAAVNKGIKKFWNSKYIAIVNNDTRCLDNNPFDGLVDFMEKHPEVGVASPKIVAMEHLDKIVHAGTIQAFPNGIHKNGLVSMNHFSEPTYEKWLSFCVVIIRVDAIKETGLLDEKMFLICSDSDYCYRLRYNGWKCAYCPDETWAHRMGESNSPTSKESTLIQRRDAHRFFKKWIEPNGLWNELDTEVFGELE